MPNKSATAAERLAWLQFAERHTGHRFLRQPVIYSLSIKLIDAITAFIPDFFDPQDRDFELDLAKTTYGGFFHGNAIDLVYQPPPPGYKMARLNATEKKLRNLQVGLLKDVGGSADYLDELDERHDERAKVHDRVRAAYQGWVAINPNFRHEVSVLKSKWEKVIARFGRFPQMPKWLMEDDEERQLPAALRYEFTEFYLGWNIETMKTWEWPVPMMYQERGNLRPHHMMFSAKEVYGEPIRTEVGIDIQQMTLKLEQAGLVFFVPHYLLRSQDINLNQALIDATPDRPDHLRGWINLFDDKIREEKLVTYQRAFSTYRFRNLAIQARYANQCHRKAGALDKVFGYVDDLDPATTRRTRRLVESELSKTVAKT